jgi:hypothetical protein
MVAALVPMYGMVPAKPKTITGLGTSSTIPLVIENCTTIILAISKIDGEHKEKVSGETLTQSSCTLA